MILRKNLLATLLLTLCSLSIPIRATDDSSKTLLEKSDEETNGGEKNKKGKKESFISSLTLSQTLKWGALTILLSGAGIYVYQREEAKKPLSPIAEYEIFIASKNRADDAKHTTWGSTLLSNQPIKSALDQFMAPNPSAQDLTKKNGAFIDLLASYLHQEAIDITHITNDGPACIGLIPAIIHATEITPNGSAYLFAQSYYLVRDLVGGQEAKNIFNAQDSKLLDRLVAVHTSNELGNDAKHTGADPVKINAIPSIRVVITLGSADPSNELVNAAAAKPDGAKIRIEKNDADWTAAPIVAQLL